MALRRFFAVVALTSLTFVPEGVPAQGFNAALIGTVRDQQQGVLAGAAVRITSSALVGGEMRTTSDDRGQWRFPVLRPGDYTLTVELAPRFSVYREPELRLGAGATIEVPVVMQVGSITDTVNVQERFRIEARSSGVETVYRREHLRTIPTRRFSVYDAIKSAPGVSPTSPSSGTVHTVSSFGSGVNEGAYLIDGTNFTCPCQGVSRAEPGVDVVQEVQVQSIGASVEYGNIQGAVFNLLTRQGGARFEWETSAYGQSASLTSQPVVRPIGNSPGRTSGYERARYRDVSTSVGGPVLPNRLWFFGAYQYLRDYDSQPGTAPEYPRRYEQDKFFGKLNWRFTPNLHLMQSYHRESWVNPTLPTLVTPIDATQRQNGAVPSMTFGHLTHVLSNNTVWEARVGRFVMDQRNDPSSGNPKTPNRSDRITGVSSGNPQILGGLILDRMTAKVVLNHYDAALLGADHALKVGVEIERGDHYAPSIIPGGVRYVDSDGAPFQSISRRPWIEGGRTDTASFFFSDAMTIGARTTLNAGVRFDHSRASSQDLPAVGDDGYETSDTIAGLGRLYTWNVVSPRFGVTTRLTSDGRIMLRATYGRFHQGVLTGELAPVHPGVTATTTMAYEHETAGYTRLVSVVDPRINVAIDPAMRTPRTDQYSVSFEREVTSRVLATVAFVGKKGRHQIGWTDVGGLYREETRTIAGQSVPVFVLTNGTAARRFLLTNPEDYALDYRGLVVALQRRLAKGWQASGSYTYSRASGLMASSGAAAADAQLSTFAPANTFGRDPNNLTNATGLLPNDRPHVFRAFGSVQIPKVGVLVAGSVQHFTGKPWAASGQITLTQGDQRVLLEPRGTRRLSSQSLLDLRLAKPIRVGSATRVEVLIDILNVLNDAAEEGIATDNIASPTFGTPSVSIDPRRAMVGVRVTFGG